VLAQCGMWWLILWDVIAHFEGCGVSVWDVVAHFVGCGGSVSVWDEVGSVRDVVAQCGMWWLSVGCWGSLCDVMAQSRIVFNLNSPCHNFFYFLLPNSYSLLNQLAALECNLYHLVRIANIALAKIN
jgi:hypothetical protein